MTSERVNASVSETVAVIGRGGETLYDGKCGYEVNARFAEQGGQMIHL